MIKNELENIYFLLYSTVLSKLQNFLFNLKDKIDLGEESTVDKKFLERYINTIISDLNSIKTKYLS